MIELGQVDLDKYQRLLDSLPFGEAPLKMCPISKELGRRAPEGKAFRMSGQFWVERDFRNDYCDFRPQQSMELFISEHQDKYDELLEESGEDRKRAFGWLKEDMDSWDELDDEEFPDDFIGKWLVVSVGKPLTIKVKSDPIIWFERQDFLPIDDIGPYPISMGDMGEPVVVWNQFYAEAEEGNVKVELVDYKEPKPELYVPKQQDPKKIEQPFYTRNPTLSEWVKYMEPILQRPFSEEEKLYWMRHYRMYEYTFADDPLKDFEFPQPRILRPEEPKVVLPERESRRWIIKPGEEHLMDRYRKIERGEIQF